MPCNDSDALRVALAEADRLRAENRVMELETQIERLRAAWEAFKDEPSTPTADALTLLFATATASPGQGA